MKKPLLLLVTLLSLAGCGVSEISAPRVTHSTGLRLQPEDSAVVAFADSMAASPTLADRPTRNLRRSASPLKP